MPLTFPARAPVDETKRVSAAQIVSIAIDNKSARVHITVEYGDMVNGNFVANANVPARTHMIPAAGLAATIPPLPAAGMYDNVKRVAWDALIASGLETGVVS